MSVQPRKRKRTGDAKAEEEDETAQSSLQSAQRDLSLWYEDGNVVLCAGKTLFRVHRSILSRQSSVLADITSAYEPVATETDKQVEGCVVIHLVDDSDDIAHMLHGIYDNRIHAQGQLPFPVVSAWFRMGSEYEITYLRDAALSRLSACYPNTLEGYDKMEDSSSLRRPIVWTPTQDYDVAVLAQKQSLHSILVTALYECCAGSPEELAISLGFDNLHIPKPSPRFEPVILQRLFIGRAELSRLRILYPLSFLDGKVSPSCRKKSRCKDAIADIVHTTYHVGAFGDNARALDRQDDLLDEAVAAQRSSTLGNGNLCDVCVPFCKERYRQGRMRVWESLPSIFRVPEEL